METSVKPNRSKQQKPTHTPEPWELGEIKGSGMTKSVMIKPLVGVFDGFTRTNHQFEANAHLIAVAPELLAALKETLETLGDIADKLVHGSPLRNDLEAECAAIRAVIDKAEGR